jgi:hypothetical protein
MPVSYTFDDRIIVVHLVGHYSSGEMLETVVASLNDPELPRNPMLMLDLRASQSMPERSAEEVRSRARDLAVHGAGFGHRIAMIAPTDLAYGMMRIASAAAAAGGLFTKVFRDFEAARAWLTSFEPPHELSLQ